MKVSFGSLSDGLHALNVPDPPVTEPENEEPARRTPTETLVADFLVTLLGGMACLVQPLNSNPLCMPNSYETTFQFGPVRGTSQQQGSDPVKFRARVDGSIPFSLSQGEKTPREAIIFEAKRAPRKDGEDIAVLAQQSMEHVAYIWQRHVYDPMVLFPFSVPPYFHLFLLTQPCYPSFASPSSPI